VCLTQVLFSLSKEWKLTNNFKIFGSKESLNSDGQPISPISTNQKITSLKSLNTRKTMKYDIGKLGSG
jgi:hypothetical protein